MKDVQIILHITRPGETLEILVTTNNPTQYLVITISWKMDGIVSQDRLVPNSTLDVQIIETGVVPTILQELLEDLIHNCLVNHPLWRCVLTHVIINIIVILIRGVSPWPIVENSLFTNSMELHGIHVTLVFALSNKIYLKKSVNDNKRLGFIQHSL